MHPLCKTCEYNSGKKCTQGLTDPFFNACQHVMDIVDNCISYKKFKVNGILIEIKSCKECPQCLKLHSGPTVTWRCGFTKKRRAIAYNVEYKDEEPLIPKWCPYRKKEYNR